LQDVLLAVGLRQTLVHLGTLETDVDKLDVGAELYIKKFQVLQSEFDSLKILMGVMIKDNMPVCLWKQVTSESCIFN